MKMTLWWQKPIAAFSFEQMRSSQFCLANGAEEPGVHVGWYLILNHAETMDNCTFASFVVGMWVEPEQIATVAFTVTSVESSVDVPLMLIFSLKSSVMHTAVRHPMGSDCHLGPGGGKRSERAAAQWRGVGGESQGHGEWDLQIDMARV